MKILFEDSDIIVCEKPAGLPVQTASLTQPDLESELKKHLAGGYLAVIHRLDQPVEGLILFAKNPRAAAALSKQVQNGGGMNKHYLARIRGHMAAERGKCEDLLVKDARTNRSRIAKEGEAGAKRAVLEYEVLEKDADTELLGITLHTGRHHQIRVQLSSRGVPIVGDGKYGGKEAGSGGAQRLCLAADRLEFVHPATGERMNFQITAEF